ncbi:MAG: hypothetical protein ACRD01_10405 [Terriglobales bacterium]
MSTIHRRVLALDVHARRAGFALLESPHRLVDWGMLYFEDRDRSPARQAAALIELTRPERIVLVTPANQTLARRRVQKMVVTLTRAASASHVRLVVFSRRDVLSVLGVRRRHAAAVLVAQRFPALAPRLPRPRRTQDNEHPAMCLFDAASAGLAYFEKYGRHRAAAPPPHAA